MSKEELILDAALKLFVENGFHATPTAAIAKEAGVSNGTLFNYFKTKEILINNLYINSKSVLVQTLQNGINEATNVKGKFRNVWTNMIRWALNNPLKFHFFQQFSNSPFIDKLTKEEIQSRFDFITDLITEGQKQEIIKDINPEILLPISYATITGALQYFIINPEAFEDNSLQDKVFNIFWDALKS